MVGFPKLHISPKASPRAPTATSGANMRMRLMSSTASVWLGWLPNTKYTDDANVISAAMMHDVLEDTDVMAEEMRRVFGDAITDLVLEVTDVSRPSDGKRAVRKEKDKGSMKAY